MSIVAEVKCARCDRLYSGVRSRCPYCGARRIGRGKYSDENDGAKGKMLIGIIVLAVLVVAVIVLLLTTDKPDDNQELSTPPPSQSESQTPEPIESGNEGVSGRPVETSHSPPEESVSEEPSVSPSPTVTSVMITYTGYERKEFTAKIGEQVPLKIKVEPPGVEADVEWSSSNTSIFDVVQTDINGSSATVTAKQVGNATLTVRVGDINVTCIVRVIK